MTKSGQLRNKVIFQSLQSVLDINTQEYVKEWSDVLSAFTKIVWTKGREFLTNYDNAFEVAGRIYMRYRKGITNDMRVLIDDVPYNILSAIPTDYKKTELEITFSRVS